MSVQLTATNRLVYLRLRTSLPFLRTLVVATSLSPASTTVRTNDSTLTTAHLFSCGGALGTDTILDSGRVDTRTFVKDGQCGEQHLLIILGVCVRRVSAERDD
jgi:hypothetical protein